MLEVSSPGLDRVLKKEKDFKRELGKQVDVSFYAPRNGSKTMTGKLAGYDGANVTIDEESIAVLCVAFASPVVWWLLAHQPFWAVRR
jgi:ribosome maturation factor RimP